jgi:hypothetical protein
MIPFQCWRVSASCRTISASGRAWAIVANAASISPGVPHFDGLKRHPECLRRSLALSPRVCECRVGRIPENRALRKPGHHLLEYRQTFCAEDRGLSCSAGHIAAGVSKARDHSALDRTDRVREHHRDGGGRILDGQRCWRRRHDNDVNFQPHHLGGKLRKAIRVAFRIAALNDEVAALRISQLPKAIEHRVVESLVSLGDKPHPPSLARLLSARSEWPGSHGATDKGNEIASSHDALGKHRGCWGSMRLMRRSKTSSFDHLIGTGEECRRQRQSDRLRGLEVGDELKRRGLLHRQVGGLRAF